MRHLSASLSHGATAWCRCRPAVCPAEVSPCLAATGLVHAEGMLLPWRVRCHPDRQAGGGHHLHHLQQPGEAGRVQEAGGRRADQLQGGELLRDCAQQGQPRRRLGGEALGLALGGTHVSAMLRAGEAHTAALLMERHGLH